MSIQLTTELLHTFIEKANRRAEQTLSERQTLTASVFGTTAHFHLVGAQINHPLRHILGLSTEFILVSAHTPSADIKLRPVHSLTCGAPPLATWRGLASRVDEKVVDAAKYAYEWDAQHLVPLDRNQARALAAQYAQILPALEAKEEETDVLPMIVFTREYGVDANVPPFYLGIFAPDAQQEDAFANVVVIRCAEQRHRQDMPVMLDGASEDTQRMAHWAEYDVLGSPAQSEMTGETDAALLALSKDNEDDDTTSMLSAVLTPSTSYAVLHGVWEAETRNGAKIQLPPRPPASTQWVLELLSTPVTRDAEASGTLRRLHLELRRLETWCAAWASSEAWDGGPVGSHEWQRDVPVGSQNDTETIDEAGDALERHRVQLGRRIDMFIDQAAGGCIPDDDADEVEEGVTVQRRALDFVEQLWQLAQHAHDTADLAEMLAAVGEALDTRALQPAVHRENGAPLAQMLRATLAEEAEAQVARNRLDAQLDRWIDEQPLEAFVHMGAAKLTSDLRHRLVAGRLVTPRQVDVFLSDASKDEPLQPMQVADRLRCLLRVLEAHALVVRAAPGLPRTHAAQVAEAVLDHFGSRAAHYEDLRINLCLPVYSLDAQDFAASVVDAFDPARYAVGAGRALVMMTTTPAMVDRHFAADDDNVEDENAADGSEAAEDVYAVFEAS
ncbi:hypothetical protein GGI05_001538 [Coemansia sp. RSA 2603]|nr:hypothetical protein GGI05_001538 [Coemansia sp. RSA 2603]